MATRRKASVFKRGASYYVQWRTIDGKRHRRSFGTSESEAERFAALKTAELIEGLRGTEVLHWQDLADRVESTSTASPETLRGYLGAMAQFERIIKPGRIDRITSADIDLFKSIRLKEKGRNGTMSIANVNRELRALKRVLRLAAKWDLIPKSPHIELIREPKNGITWISVDHFAAFYGACHVAKLPRNTSIDPGLWWRAYLSFAYMTGWRANEIRRLLWEDVDMERGIAITRAGDNKARKEAAVPIHDFVLEHLKLLPQDTPEVFPWPDGDKQLWPELHRIQEEAGIKRVCRKNHEHRKSCEWFGMHDFRRGFATVNAKDMTPSQLQIQMRHASYLTTQEYIDMAEQSKRSEVVDKLVVPNVKIGGVK